MSNPNPVHSSTNLFRRLAWQSSVSISVRIADGEPGAGSGADRYFIQAPRYSYLPLLLPELRENLVELVLDDKQLEGIDEKDWWLEEEVDEDSRSEGGFAPQGVCRWHWPIDLIELHSYISAPQPIPSSSFSSSSSSSLGPTAPRQLKLLLHLTNPPADKLLMPNTIETCKSRWLNSVKEADFVKWRNTNRVTNLRRADLEAGWDGIVQDDYDLYLRMASRLLPLPIPLPPTTSSNSTSYPNHGHGQNHLSRPPSTDPSSTSAGSSARSESSYATRGIPIKFFLPDNAPVVQHIIPPIGADGKPTTLISVLHQHLPLLFPTRTPTKSNTNTNTSSNTQSRTRLSSSLGPEAMKEKEREKEGDPYILAFPVVQGILIPPQTEVAWLSASVCGADGWIRVGVCIRAY